MKLSKIIQMQFYGGFYGIYIHTMCRTLPPEGRQFSNFKSCKYLFGNLKTTQQYLNINWRLWKWSEQVWQFKNMKWRLLIWKLQLQLQLLEPELQRVFFTAQSVDVVWLDQITGTEYGAATCCSTKLQHSSEQNEYNKEPLEVSLSSISVGQSKVQFTGSGKFDRYGIVL